MRRTKIAAILSVILTMTLLLMSVSLTFVGISCDDELILARQAAHLELESDCGFPQFEGAHLASAQPYYDLEGNLICYMFGVAKDGEIMGTIIVGSSVYNNGILEINTAPPPSVPSAADVKECLENDLGIVVDEGNVAKPERLLHLGVASDWALYQIEGQLIAVHLWMKIAAPASELEFSMSTPEQYRQYYEMTRYNLDLKTGWNLISLPVHPSRSNIEVVLISVTDYLESVWHYDVSSERKRWTSWTPTCGGDLNRMLPGQGYWIHVTSDCTLTVVLRDSAARVYELDLNVYEGWNIVGSLYVDGRWESNPPGQVVQLRGWDAALQQEYIETEKMEPGKGYWMQVSEDCIAEITPQL